MQSTWPRQSRAASWRCDTLHGTRTQCTTWAWRWNDGVSLKFSPSIPRVGQRAQIAPRRARPAGKGTGEVSGGRLAEAEERYTASVNFLERADGW